MDPIRFSIENPVKVSVGVILTVLVGLVSLGVIPVQLTPNTDPTIITVTTNWTGKAPDEIEKDIILEQEDVLKNLRGLEKMTANAFQGQGEIELEFRLGVPLDVARVQVSDALREVPEYPEGVDEPVINTGEAGAGSPIAWLLLISETPGFDVQALGDPAEEQIKPYLERTAGVSEVRVYGGREREVHINFDPKRIAQRGVTLLDINSALRQENVNISAGETVEGRYDTRVRVVGEYEDLDSIRETIVAYREGGPITIGDLATVELTLSKRRSFVRSKGDVAMALPVYRESGANVMRVMDELRGRIAEVNETVLPRVARQYAESQGHETIAQLNLRQVYDETIYIDDALALVRNNLIIGGTLAVMVLLLFLRSVRPTLVVALAIPVSVVGTFVVMAILGRNLNVISLAGLAFAVGMVVDNAIVVLENIDRHLGMGKRPVRAAFDAAREVWGAILASTLTTLVVFIPILFMQEEVGQLFRDIAIAICAAVTLSLIVSITVIPTASSRFLQTRREPRGLGRVIRSLFGIAPLAKHLANGFVNTLHTLMQRTPGGVLARVAIVLVFASASVLGALALMPPLDYLPAGNKNLVFGFVLKAPGYALSKHENDARGSEAILQPLWEHDDPQTLPDVGIMDMMSQQPVENLPGIENYFHVAFRGNAFHGAISQDKNNVKPLAPALSTAAMLGAPGAFAFTFQSSIFGRGSDTSRTINVEVMGDDLDEVNRGAEALLGVLRGRFGFPNARPSPSNFDRQSREVTVKIDRVKAKDLDLDTATLGRAIEAFIDGSFVGEFRYQGETLDILAKNMAGGDAGFEPEALATLPLAYDNRGNPDGGEQSVTTLESVVNLERTLAPQEIRRVEEFRAVQIQVQPPEDVPLETATAEVNGIIDGLRSDESIPPGVITKLAGSASKLDEVKTALLGKTSGFNLDTLLSVGTSRMFLALLVVYLLMAALFESFLYPIVIMISVPLATVGGFLGLAFVHDGWGMADWPVIGESLYGVFGPDGLGWIVPTQQLDTLTMLGFVILIGVVVNNAILIVHQSLNFMRGIEADLIETADDSERNDVGLEPAAAIRESVRSRIRPIFMTTLTSVAGMAPLMLMPGSGSELYRGLGSVVVGGLIVATLFTLLVVPCLFSLVMDLTAKLGSPIRLRSRVAQELAEPA